MNQKVTIIRYQLYFSYKSIPIILFVQIVVRLFIWCLGIKKSVPASQLLHESKLFIDGLNEVAKQLSSLLFGIISLTMINTITIFYISITQIMNADDHIEWERQMIFISNGIVALCCFYGLYLVHDYYQKINLLNLIYKYYKQIDFYFSVLSCI